MILPVLMALLVLLGASASADALELRLAYTDQNTHPYLTGSGLEIPARPGIAVELVQRAVTRIGGSLRLTRLPARRMVEEVKAGRQDGILGFRYSAARAQDLAFPMLNGQPDGSRHAARLAHSLYRRHSSLVQWDGQRLTGLNTPVAVSGTQLVSEALLAQGIEIIRIENSGRMFDMLALGRVDAVVTLDIIGDRQMREQAQLRAQLQDRGQIEKLAPPVLVEDFHVPVSQRFYAGNRDFSERLWQGIGALRESTYAELMPQYLL
jgi:polar amino acid transport system substrate-binding protein